MPLHEWTERAGWEGMRHLWTTKLLRSWLPPGWCYRVSQSIAP